MESTALDLHPDRGDSRFVLVPRVVGALGDVDLTVDRPRDDLDALIDDVFGDPVDERPGWLDVALVAAGAALIAWMLLGGPVIGGIVGAVLLVLGLALPGRDLLRRVRGRRRTARLTWLLSQGMLLDVGHPATRRLADAYARLEAASRRPGVPKAEEALAAGHLAVTEAASLLHGRTPAVAAEVEYVERRAMAVEAVADELERLADRARSDAVLAELGVRQDAELHAEMVAVAREELDALGGMGSLAQLDAVGDQLRRERTDAATG